MTNLNPKIKRKLLLILAVVFIFLLYKLKLDYFYSIAYQLKLGLEITELLNNVATLFLGLVMLTLFISFHERSLLKWRVKWWFPVLGVVFFVALMEVNIIFSQQTTANQASWNSVLSEDMTPFSKGMLLLNLVLLGPFTEEMFFRLAVMNLIFKDSKLFLDVIISSIVFGLAHVMYFPWSTPAFLLYMLSGVVFGLLFRLTKSIYWPLLLHIAWNVFVSWPEIDRFLYYTFFF